MRAVGKAPGKLILSGEHAVVYGHRAIAAAVPLHVTVTLSARPGPLTVDGQDDPRLLDALATVLPNEGYGVALDSELPPGAGMGSSAAIAVATVRAWAAIHGESPSPDACFERSWKVERVFHGNPSGVDQAVSSRGGVLSYRRDPLELRPLTLPEPLTLIVVHTGRPSRSTAEMVAAVREGARWDLLERIGALSQELEGRLVSGGDVGDLLDENHRLLMDLGVSTPELDGVCGAMRKAGARGAKLAGAGGGGIAFSEVSAERADAVERAAAAWGPAWRLRIGAERSGAEPNCG